MNIKNGKIRRYYEVTCHIKKEMAILKLPIKILRSIIAEYYILCNGGL